MRPARASCLERPRAGGRAWRAPRPLNVSVLRCCVCGRDYAPGEVEYVCPLDGGNLDVLYDWDAVGRVTSPDRLAAEPDRSIWRYLPLLPVEDRPTGGSPLGEVGWSPLYRPQRLEQALGLEALWLKDDGRLPSASFKDRASAVVVQKAVELGRTRITTASSGNAGAALGLMAACAGLEAVIFVPAGAPQAKVAQLLIFGATVILVEGSYDAAYELCLEASQAFGWYCRNTGYNPFTAEGKKTASFELAEQLGWQPPERVYVAVGDGNIITGLHKGFRDLRDLGWIARLPKLVGVQAEGAPAVYRAWKEGLETPRPARADSMADSINVGLPRDGRRALRAVRKTAGELRLVSDAEILAAMAELGREGVFVEPAAATAYAGLCQAPPRGETVAVVLTGSGLKDVPSAMRAVSRPHRIAPSLAALKRALAV